MISAGSLIMRRAAGWAWLASCGACELPNWSVQHAGAVQCSVATEAAVYAASALVAGIGGRYLCRERGMSLTWRSGVASCCVWLWLPAFLWCVLFASSPRQ